MYIIIHKYQRWSVNETKQKYLKNMSKEKQKKPTYQKMVQRRPKTSLVCFSRRSSSSDKSFS